jgi:hypothetical protein
MTLSRALKQIRDVALIVLLASLIVLANRAYYTLDDLRNGTAGTRRWRRPRKHSSRSTSLSRIPHMLNANLIHADLILGRAETSFT